VKGKKKERKKERKGLIFYQHRWEGGWVSNRRRCRGVFLIQGGRFLVVQKLIDLNLGSNIWIWAPHIWVLGLYVGILAPYIWIWCHMCEILAPELENRVFLKGVGGGWVGPTGPPEVYASVSGNCFPRLVGLRRNGLPASRFRDKWQIWDGKRKTCFSPSRIVIVTFLPVQNIFVPAGPKCDVHREGCDQKRHHLKIIFLCARVSHSFQKRDKCDASHLLSPKKVTNLMSLTQIMIKRWQMWRHSDRKKHSPPGGFPIYYVPWSRTVCKRTPSKDVL